VVSDCRWIIAWVVRTKRRSLLAGPFFHPINQPPQKFFRIPYIDLSGQIRQFDFSPRHIFVAAGRAQLSKAFFGNITGIFSNAVVSENDNELFIARTGYDAPSDGYDSHEKISYNNTHIWIHDRTQMNKNPAFSQPHSIQCGFKIFQKIKPQVSLLDFARQVNIDKTKKILKGTHIFDHGLAFKGIGVDFNGIKEAGCQFYRGLYSGRPQIFGHDRSGGAVMGPDV
jgi:hypothetical protein